MELKQLIDMLIKEKGGTRRQYHLLMDKIGHHESGNIVDRLQMGKGPGRGLYQFERGDSKGGKTAANRLTNYLRKNNQKIPQWLSKLSKNKSVDASKLTKEQQQMLFLGYHREKQGSDFSKVFKGEQSVTDFWADNHWAGEAKDRAARVKSFGSHLKTFKAPTYDFESEVPKEGSENFTPPTNYWEKFLPQQSALPESNQAPSTAPNNQGYGINLDQFDLGTNRMASQTPQQSEDPNQLTNKRLSAEEMGFMQNNNVAAMGGYMNSFADGGPIDPDPLDALIAEQKTKKKAGIKPRVDTRNAAIDNTSVASTALPTSKMGEIKSAEQIEAEKLAAYQASLPTMKKNERQSVLSKTKEVLLNPMTAAGYIATNQDIPDNFSKGPRNAYDYAIDVINPAQYLEDGKNVIEGTAKGDLAQVGEGALGILPLGAEAKNLYKGAKNLTKATNKVLDTKVDKYLDKKFKFNANDGITKFNDLGRGLRDQRVKKINPLLTKTNLGIKKIEKYLGRKKQIDINAAKKNPQSLVKPLDPGEQKEFDTFLKSIEATTTPKFKQFANTYPQFSMYLHDNDLLKNLKKMDEVEALMDDKEIVEDFLKQYSISYRGGAFPKNVTDEEIYEAMTRGGGGMGGDGNYSSNSSKIFDLFSAAQPGKNLPLSVKSKLNLDLGVDGLPPRKQIEEISKKGLYGRQYKTRPVKGAKDLEAGNADFKDKQLWNVERKDAYEIYDTNTGKVFPDAQWLEKPYGNAYERIIKPEIASKKIKPEIKKLKEGENVDNNAIFKMGRAASKKYKQDLGGFSLNDAFMKKANGLSTSDIKDQNSLIKALIDDPELLSETLGSLEKNDMVNQKGLFYTVEKLKNKMRLTTPEGNKQLITEFVKKLDKKDWKKRHLISELNRKRKITNDNIKSATGLFGGLGGLTSYLGYRILNPTEEKPMTKEEQKIERIKEEDSYHNRRERRIFRRESESKGREFNNSEEFDKAYQEYKKRPQLKKNILNTIDNLRNDKAMGGYTEGGDSEDGKFNSFNNGGTHEQNPHGGVPLGTGSNGKMNTVEEGETSFEFKEGKFIFSNRIKL